VRFWLSNTAMDPIAEHADRTRPTSGAGRRCAAIMARSVGIHIHGSHALPRARVHDQEYSRQAGGLPLVRKDQETEPAATGFDGEGCSIAAGDAFTVHSADQNGMVLTRGGQTGDEVSKLVQVTGSRPPGATGACTGSALRRCDRGRPRHGCDDVQGLAAVPRQHDRFYR